MSGPPSHPNVSPSPAAQQQPPHYEPDSERRDSRSYPVSPEGTRRNPPRHVVASTSSSRSSESPHLAPALPDSKDRRLRPKKRKQEI